MAYGNFSLEKRLGENIKNYELSTLFDYEGIVKQAKLFNSLFHINIYITNRHGEELLCMGKFEGFCPDVVKNPGRKIRIENRTVAHLYVNYDNVPKQQKEQIKELFETMIYVIEQSADKTYYAKETSIYIDDLEEKLEKDMYQVKHGVKLDALTEVLNRTYFENRLRIVDRSQIAPVAAICININDWKFVNDYYGEEESDRLIKVIASIIKKYAKPEYIIGRVDGDVFHVLITMPEDEECEEYCRKIKDACEKFEDKILAPSVAIGSVIKENVEESLSELFSDAEYVMFEDKFNMKNAEGYRKRLEKGIQI